MPDILLAIWGATCAIGVTLATILREFAPGHKIGETILLFPAIITSVVAIGAASGWLVAKAILFIG